jgi:hypothetical protein
MVEVDLRKIAPAQIAEWLKQYVVFYAMSHYRLVLVSVVPEDPHK